ncbi:MAG: hypothetical protein HXY24_03310 [Rubrivivax sp.]|nr:hypothetical protein [Rubrivivax sp.]
MMPRVNVLRPRRARQGGLSIVELLVGVAIGLFIVAGATALFVNYLGSNRALVLETRVNHTLRTAADLIARDLRRTGYWRNSLSGVWRDGAPPTATNPYAAVAYDSGVPTKVGFQYATDDNDTVDDNEEFGFRFAGDALEMLDVNGDWVPVTRASTVRILAAESSVQQSALRTVELWRTCPCLEKGTCTTAQFEAGVYPDRPRLTLRQYTITLVGQSAADPTVRRRLVETVRIRNDVLEGVCPNP